MPSPEFPESNTNANCWPYSVLFGPRNVGARTSRTLVSGLKLQPLSADRGPSSDTLGVSKPALETNTHGAFVVELVEVVELVLVVDDVELVELVVDEVEVVEEVVVVEDVLEVELVLCNRDSSQKCHYQTCFAAIISLRWQGSNAQLCGIDPRRKACAAKAEGNADALVYMVCTKRYCVLHISQAKSLFG